MSRQSWFTRVFALTAQGGWSSGWKDAAGPLLQGCKYQTVFLRSEIVAKSADLLPNSKLDIFYPAHFSPIISLLPTTCLPIVALPVVLRIRPNLALCMARLKDYVLYIFLSVFFFSFSVRLPWCICAKRCVKEKEKRSKAGLSVQLVGNVNALWTLCNAAAGGKPALFSSLWPVHWGCWKWGMISDLGHVLRF